MKSARNNYGFLFVFWLLALPVASAENEIETLISEEFSSSLERLENYHEFELKREEVEKLQVKLEAIEDRLLRYEEKQIDIEQIHAFSTISSAFNAVNVEELTLANCASSLNSLVVAFDPQSNTPRLTRHVKSVYNLVATACGKENL